jgi:hypothetical protein
MPEIVFRCPETGYKVQATFEDQRVQDAFVRLACMACGLDHAVNRYTARVEGDHCDAPLDGDF